MLFPFSPIATTIAAAFIPTAMHSSVVPSPWVVDAIACSQAIAVLLLHLRSLGRLFLRRPPLFLSSLPLPSTILAISLSSLTARTKSPRHSLAAPAFCSQPLPPAVVIAALVSPYKRITVTAAALTGHSRCLLPSLPTASSPWPPAASYYASSPRPAVIAKPSSDAPAPATGQPHSSSSIVAKALTNAVAVLLLCLLYLFFSLPYRFYRSQALLCCSLNLLFFIIAGQPLPSSIAATTVPLCSTRTLLPLPLEPPQPPPRPCPPLPPRPPLFLPSAPHDTTASSLATIVLATIAAFKRTPAAAPPCYHHFTLLPPLPLLVVSISSKKECRHNLFFNCCLICLLS
ncbi:hypothetical protein BHM03_00008030 [Ensete ventricosum]|nr:hypothetical protein BHM03_00008030 [Ensete ventricosum]